MLGSWGDYGFTPINLTVPYGQLMEELRSLDLDLARKQARFVPPALREDDSLHHCKYFVSWLRAVKGTHGADTG